MASRLATGGAIEASQGRSDHGDARGWFRSPARAASEERVHGYCSAQPQRGDPVLVEPEEVADLVEYRDLHLLAQLVFGDEGIEQVGEEHHDAGGAVGDGVAAAAEVLGALEQPEGPRVEALPHQLGIGAGLEHHGHGGEPGGEGLGQAVEGLGGHALDERDVGPAAHARAAMGGGVEAQDLEVVAHLRGVVAGVLAQPRQRIVGVGQRGVQRHRARQPAPGDTRLIAGPRQLPLAREHGGIVGGHGLGVVEVGGGGLDPVVVEEIERFGHQVVDHGPVRGIEGRGGHGVAVSIPPAASACNGPVSGRRRGALAGAERSEYGPASVPVRVHIRDFAHGGEGVGQQDDGLTWFVPDTLPGETVEVEPEQRKARWARGRLLQVIEPGPDRVTPPCPLADRCGGCDWQHVARARQPEHKRRIVAGQLRGLGIDEASVKLADAPTEGPGYRRRVRMHYAREADGTLRLGFFAARSRQLVDVPHCPVLRPELDRAVQRIREMAEHLPREGEVLGLSDGTRVALALPGVRPDEPVLEAAHERLDGELVGMLLRGGRRSTAVGEHELRLDGGDGLAPMHAHPFVFTQANAAVNRALVRHVARAARPDGRRVLELYAGAGNLSRALARTAKRVWTLDDDREARSLLRSMSHDAGLPINAKQGSAPSLLATLAEKNVRYDVVVVDPPRRGLGEATAAHLAAVAEQRVVYVSCDPATLARDLRVLAANGLQIRDVRVFDMMPMTAQVEVVATLERVVPLPPVP